jgi:peptide deformylase
LSCSDAAKAWKPAAEAAFALLPLPEGAAVKWLSEVVLVNPVIVDKSSKTDVEEEGCLSFPRMNGEVSLLKPNQKESLSSHNLWSAWHMQVERSLTIKVKYQNVKGKSMTKKFADWEARIFQHEYDHLDGILYIDRLNKEGRAKVSSSPTSACALGSGFR